MKTKFLFIGMLLLTVTFYSCEEGMENETVTNKKSLTDYNRLYDDIITIEDLDEQLIVADGLSSIEKYTMWQLKLENFKANNQLSIDQIQFLNTLSSEISLDLFENEEERRLFNEDKKDNLMNESKRLFGAELGYYLLTKFENSNQTIQKLGKNLNDENFKNIGTIEKCNCSKDNNCTRITGLGIDGIEWEYGTCSNESCYRDSVQVFGYTLWESSNNKRCSY